MKITKPFEHIDTLDPDRELPCWFFEEVYIPDHDYETVNWENMLGKNVLTNTENFSKRKIAFLHDNEDSIIFKDISDILKKIILNIKENYPARGLEASWPIDTWSEKELLQESIVQFDLKRDSKGFHMGVHLDNRNTKWTLIMNLQDHISSTVIHTNQGDYNIPTKKGSGIFYFNHEEMYHSIGPTEDEDRITAFWMKMLS